MDKKPHVLERVSQNRKKIAVRRTCVEIWESHLNSFWCNGSKHMPAWQLVCNSFETYVLMLR